MGFLEKLKIAVREFFSVYDPNSRFLAKVMVYTHSVAYGPKDEDPRHLVNLVFVDPKYAKKFGERVQIESKKYYMNTKSGDVLFLWFEENPDYDGKHPETRLRLADRPH